MKSCKVVVVWLSMLMIGGSGSLCLAGTNELTGEYHRSSGEIEERLSGFWGEWNYATDYDSDRYFIAGTHYFADLSESANPELAVLKQHPSYVTLDLYRIEYDYEFYGEPKNTGGILSGRYSLASGLGLGGGYGYSEVSGSDHYTNNYSLFIDYSMEGRHEIRLAYGHSDDKSDSDDPFYDFDRKTDNVQLSWKGLFVDDALLVNSAIRYSTTDASTDSSLWGLDLGLAYFWDDNFSIHGGFGYSDEDEDSFGNWSGSEIKRYQYWLSPKYWFSESVNISLTVSYIDTELEESYTFPGITISGFLVIPPYVVTYEVEDDELIGALAVTTRF